MELITYPFSLLIGALVVLCLLSPLFFGAYTSCQAGAKFLTDGRFEIKTFVDKILYHKGAYSNYYIKPHYLVLLLISGVISSVLVIASLIETLAKDNGTVLGNLILFSFSLPVEAAVFASPVLLPIAILWGSLFGLRKMIRLGYDVSERLNKVENN